YFKKFNDVYLVAVSRELTFPFIYSKRTNGRTCRVLEKRGEAYYVEIKDLNKPKRYLIRPIHLKKIEAIK
ncbi:MAG: hypothetical protein AABY10_05325, partial [Nanoarchaeota archaeon]